MRFSSLCLGITLTTLGIGAIGCNSRSQLVVGLITNLRVKGQLSNVQMDLTRQNVLFQSYNWDISNQEALDFVLPGSFTLYSDNGGAPVAGITVTGFVGDAVKVVRTATIQLQAESDVFYRMSLVLKCVVGSPSATSACPEDYGCVEGVCKPNAVSAKTLTPFVPERAGQIECDSGTQYIKTGTCGTGTCLPMPVVSETCTAGEFCSEGTCYKRDPDAPRLLAFGESCEPGTTDACSDAGYICGPAKAGDRPRCHQNCSVDADCTRRLPDALAIGVPATEARCTRPTPTAARECTFACDALNTTDSGCLSGTACQVVDLLGSADPFGAECITVRSSLTPAALGQACTSEIGSCGTGAVCLSNTQKCHKLCKLSVGGCPNSTTCGAIANQAGMTSAIWGICQ